MVRTLPLIFAASLTVGLLPTYVPAAQRAVLSGAVSHGPTLTEFDAPGATKNKSQNCLPYCGTLPEDINVHGTIVGFYSDRFVVPHGFILSGGQFLSFDAPGAGLGHGLNEGTIPQSINNRGEIAGQFEDPQLTYHGFVRHTDGTFTTIDEPAAGSGPGQGTIVQDVNEGGALAGFYFDSNKVGHGFVRLGGRFASFDPPGSQGTEVCRPACFNAAGTAVGYFYDGTKEHGFVRAPGGALTVIDGPQAAGTYVTGINEGGAISGYYYDANFTYYGFVLANNQFTIYQVLGDGTAADAINAEGAESGEYFLKNEGPNYLYYRKPSGVITTFVIPGSGKHPVQGPNWFAMNALGSVTGFWEDPTGLNHGYLLTH